MFLSTHQSGSSSPCSCSQEERTSVILPLTDSTAKRTTETLQMVNVVEDIGLERVNK